MAHTATALRAPVVLAPADPLPPVEGRLPPRAGWYPDPERRATTRFFDGGDWTEHTRGPAPRAALADVAAAHAGEARSYGRFENRQASAAVLVGALSILINPLFITSTIAVILGLRGITRSRQSLGHLGRERALTGIALAAIGMATASVAVVAAIALLTPGFLRAQHAAEVQAVRTAVVQHVADRGATLASLTCPPPQPGSPVQCQAVTGRGEHLPVIVLLPSDGTAVQVTDVAPPVVVAPHRSHHRR